MRRNQSSLTAEGIAIVRAMESQKPPGERVCYDPFARRFANPWLWAVMGLFWGYAERRGPGVSNFLVARARYIDDTLQACLDEGMRQVVILGAGLDSRAYRFEEFKKGVKVFEVDHPASQPAKLVRVKKVLGQVPEYVTYVAIDFNSQSLLDCLMANGYDPILQTLFIWEGVTQYLSLAGVDSTLAFISQHSAAGSMVVFDYIYASALRGEVKRGEVNSMQRYRGLSGEGLVFGIEAGQIQPFLESRGFEAVRNADYRDFKAAYFTGANSQREAAQVYAIASGRVR